MSLTAKLLSASGGGVDKLFSDDVFSSYVYQGNGSTQTINNGIDLAGKSGMVWAKSRSSVAQHVLADTVRGTGQILQTSTTNANTATAVNVTSFNTDGYGLSSYSGSNGSGMTYVSHTFRKAPKFFDIVTYTGNGVAGRQIPHALGIAPGMMVIKATSSTSDWFTWHCSLGASQTLALNTTAAASGSGTPGYYNQTDPTSNVFSLGGSSTNLNGVTYVAYLFAHDSSADGIIQCGSFTTDASGNATVNLGWEPQYVLVKSSSGTAGVSNWVVFDSSRGLPVDANGTWLYPNTSGTEASNAAYKVKPNATGFGMVQEATTTYIYLAIRRPNKPPTLGTQVYNAIARTGTGAAATVTGVGFAPDLALPNYRDGSYGTTFIDRLRGGERTLRATTTAAEGTGSDRITSFDMNGITLSTSILVNASGGPLINHFFKRAVGVFDVVCYTGTGGATNNPKQHSLGIAPELVVLKNRGLATDWLVWHAYTAGSSNNSKSLYLNLTNSSFDSNYWGYAATPAEMTATTFGVGGTYNENNSPSYTYVAYLFATKNGISKVGSYTGNGTSQTINAGFTTGARFVMIKRTDAAGDWYVWDTVRGVVAGNDPHLSLNSSAAEITTDDSLDPASVGFIVNQLAATNINVTSASYIYLSFA